MYSAQSTYLSSVHASLPRPLAACGGLRGCGAEAGDPGPWRGQGCRLEGLGSSISVGVEGEKGGGGFQGGVLNKDYNCPCQSTPRCVVSRSCVVLLFLRGTRRRCHRRQHRRQPHQVRMCLHGDTCLRALQPSRNQVPLGKAPLRRASLPGLVQRSGAHQPLMTDLDR